MSDLTTEVRAALPDDARMDAYYYTFDRTGIAVVDAILSAVAVAGKGSHSTDGWTSNPGHDYYKGRPWLPDADCGADLIQATADRSAALILALCDRLDAAEAKYERLRRILGGDGPFACCECCPDDDPTYHAENPPNSHDLPCNRCSGAAHVSDLTARADAAESKLAAVMRLHRPDGWGGCRECSVDRQWPYPCPTIIALNGEPNV